jgi:hypothetical protein
MAQQFRNKTLSTFCRPLDGLWPIMTIAEEKELHKNLERGVADAALQILKFKHLSYGPSLNREISKPPLLVSAPPPKFTVPWKFPVTARLPLLSAATALPRSDPEVSWFISAAWP